MKYIVYITVNIVNKKYYVGVHGTETPELFDGYLGNSINRFNNLSKLKNPQEPFHYAVKKYGLDSFIRCTLKVFNTLLEALDLEALLVNEDFIKDPSTYNITLGGGAPPRADKVVFLYDLNGNFLNKFNSITTAAQSVGADDSTIGNAIKFRYESFGYYWAFELYTNLDLTIFTNNDRRVKIYVYNSKLLLVDTLDSMSDACKYFNTYLSKIQRALKLGTCLDGYYISTANPFVYPDTRTTVGMLHQYSSDGKYIKSYSNNSTIPEQYNVHAINRAIREDKTYAGYIWIRGDKLESVSPKKVNKIRKIGLYTMDGKLVKVFKTQREARKEFPNVSKVLKGQAKHCHNYIFKYEE